MNSASDGSEWNGIVGSVDKGDFNTRIYLCKYILSNLKKVLRNYLKYDIMLSEMN